VTLRAATVALVAACWAAVAWGQSGVTTTPILGLDRRPNSATGILSNFDVIDARMRLGAQVVTDYGAVADFSGTTNTGTDNCAAFTAAALAASVQGGGQVYFPCGRYLTTCDIPLYSNVVYAGCGRGNPGTSIEVAGPSTTPAVTVGFAGFQNITPRTCTGGTGAADTCDDAIGAATRGPGCVCNTNADCQSNVCAGGTARRQVQIRDLGVIVRANNGVGIDFTLISESSINNVRVTTGQSPTGTIGILLGDGAGTVAGYSNTIFESQVTALATGIRVADRANDTRILSNVISSSNGIGIQIDAYSNHAKIAFNLFQSNTTKSVSDAGSSTTYIANRWEDDTAQLVIEAGAYDARIDDNQNFSGAGTPITNSGTRTQLGGLILTDAPATCAADTNGLLYSDLSIYNTDAPKPPFGGGAFSGTLRPATCVCNASHGSGARWCQVDGDGCTSNASCG
jgi:hypothetical protein